MRARARALIEHPAVRALVFERLLLTASAALAAAALVTGRVALREIPYLLDWRLLALFFVLTIAVELGKHSDLFDRVVAFVVGRARDARTLAFALTAVTGLLAAILTNDVALLLVVPFTMLLREAARIDAASFVVLEIAAANLIGAWTPIGNPQNLFLFARGGFTPGSFLAAQLPFAAVSAALLAAAIPLLVAPRRIEPPATPAFEVEPRLAAAFAVLLGAEIAALAGIVPWPVPLALSVPAALLLGPRLRQTDFSLVPVFAFLFIGVAGLERGSFYRAIDPERLFGHGPTGLLLSGAALSQVVSNVPAALLLAPSARSAESFRALVWGVNAGGCGTPVASLANLIGAQLYFRDGGPQGPFWRRFFTLSIALLAALLAAGLSIVRLPAR